MPADTEERDLMLELILTTHRHLLRLPRAGMAISEVHPSTCYNQQFRQDQCTLLARLSTRT